MLLLSERTIVPRVTAVMWLELDRNSKGRTAVRRVQAAPGHRTGRAPVAVLRVACIERYAENVRDLRGAESRWCPGCDQHRALIR